MPPPRIQYNHAHPTAMLKGGNGADDVPHSAAMPRGNAKRGGRPLKNIDSLELSEKLGETARRVRLAVLALEGLESTRDTPPISELLQKVEREIKEVADRTRPAIDFPSPDLVAVNRSPTSAPDPRTGLTGA
jgi:hypothetical protein